MIIIINKAVGIFGALITQGTAKASQRPYMLTGRLVFQKSTDGTADRETPVVDTDYPADTLKSWI